MVSASRRAGLIGALVAALATLPGLGIGTLWDNSETAYGEVAREILLSGDWIVMHLNGAAWFVQPPFYFWLAALFAKVFGTTEFALRLPSALATIAMAGAVGYVVARIASARAALLAGLVLSTSLMQAVIGRLAIMDALLDLFVTVAILAWFAALRTGGRRWWYLGWATLALGTLTKGPVAPVVTLLVIVPWALWDRAMLRTLYYPGPLKWLGGIALYAAIIAPWAFALVHEAGFAALAEMIGHYTFGRYVGTIENQSGAVYYYVPVIVLGFFPWIVYAVPAAIATWRSARADTNGSLGRLVFVWAVVPFVFFSFAQTKLPNYIALELPALAVMVALWLDGVVESEERRPAILWTAMVPVAIVCLGFAMWAFSYNNALQAGLLQVRTGMIGLGIALMVGSLCCVALLRVRRIAYLAPFALGGGMVVVMLMIALSEPMVERFKPIPVLAAAIDRERQPGDVVAIEGARGGNALVFYTTPPVLQLDPLSREPGHDAAFDPRRTLCAAPRAFVVTTRDHTTDPTYGRRRRTLATSGKDLLYLYDGPRCASSEDAHPN